MSSSDYILHMWHWPIRLHDHLRRRRCNTWGGTNRIQIDRSRQVLIKVLVDDARASRFTCVAQRSSMIPQRSTVFTVITQMSHSRAISGPDAWRTNPWRLHRSVEVVESLPDFGYAIVRIQDALDLPGRSRSQRRPTASGTRTLTCQWPCPDCSHPSYSHF